MERSLITLTSRHDLVDVTINAAMNGFDLKEDATLAEMKGKGLAAASTSGTRAFCGAVEVRRHDTTTKTSTGAAFQHLGHARNHFERQGSKQGKGSEIDGVQEPSVDQTYRSMGPLSEDDQVEYQRVEEARSASIDHTYRSIQPLKKTPSTPAIDRQPLIGNCIDPPVDRQDNIEWVAVDRSPVSMGKLKRTTDWTEEIWVLEERSSSPEVEAAEKYLTPDMIEQIMERPFRRSNDQNPMDHILRFEEIIRRTGCNENGQEHLRLKFFPISLDGKAARWDTRFSKQYSTGWEFYKHCFLENFYKDSIWSRKQGKPERKRDRHREHARTHCETLPELLSIMSITLEPIFTGNATAVEDASKTQDDKQVKDQETKKVPPASVDRSYRSVQFVENTPSTLTVDRRHFKDKELVKFSVDRHLAVDIKCVDPPIDRLTRKDPVDTSVDRQGSEGYKVRSVDWGNPKPSHPLKVMAPSEISDSTSSLEKTYKDLIEAYDSVMKEVTPSDSVSAQLKKNLLRAITAQKKSIEKIMQDRAEFSRVIPRKMPEKVVDPGAFTIPCKIGKQKFPRCLVDLGAGTNIMPFSTAKELGLTNLEKANTTLLMADASEKEPVGLAVDVPVRIGKGFVLTDFMVVEMDAEPVYTIVFGRPFLATTKAKIDVGNHKMEFTTGSKVTEFTRMGPKVKPSHRREIDLAEKAQLRDIPERMRMWAQMDQRRRDRLAVGNPGDRTLKDLLKELDGRAGDRTLHDIYHRLNLRLAVTELNEVMALALGKRTRDGEIIWDSDDGSKRSRTWYPGDAESSTTRPPV